MSLISKVDSGHLDSFMCHKKRKASRISRHKRRELHIAMASLILLTVSTKLILLILAICAYSGRSFVSADVKTTYTDSEQPIGTSKSTESTNKHQSARSSEFNMLISRLFHMGSANHVIVSPEQEPQLSEGERIQTAPSDLHYFGIKLQPDNEAFQRFGRSVQGDKSKDVSLNYTKSDRRHGFGSGGDGRQTRLFGVTAGNFIQPVSGWQDYPNSRYASDGQVEDESGGIDEFKKFMVRQPSDLGVSTRQELSMTSTTPNASAGAQIKPASSYNPKTKSEDGISELIKVVNSTSSQANNSQVGQASRAPLTKVAKSSQDNEADEFLWSRRSFCISDTQEFNWLCQGFNLMRIPSDLEPKPISLRLVNIGIEGIDKNSLVAYRGTLRDFSIENAPRLLFIGEDSFEQMVKLRVVYIVKAPKLIAFDFAVSGRHPDLRMIRIHQTRLKHWPDMSRFKQEKILLNIDLGNNNLDSLGSRPINIRTELLNLEFNQINSIGEFTFNGSEIGILSLSGNKHLTFIHENAFSNLKNLVRLDLSSTSISQLPTKGLQQLTHLIVRETFALKQIPSIYEFPALQDAQLTYAYHCCSFRHPKTHDPSAYEQHLKLQEEINSLCMNKSPRVPDVLITTSTDLSQTPGFSTETEASGFEGVFDTATSSPSNAQTTQAASLVTDATEKMATINGKLVNRQTVECGELAKPPREQNISCTPEPDAFNPCEDIMGYSILRVAVWFVVAASIMGNLSVIVVLMGVLKRMSVPKFLQLNLAIGDMFMGVYLAMLALADLTTVGTYFNYAIDWQHGYGCKVAGAASIFASQLSIFTLSVITFERYYTITYSIDLNMRLQLGWASRIMLFGWLYAFASAMLPIFADVNSYSKTSICLPMRTSCLADKIFILILLVMDSCAFVIIFACYLKMYLLILRQKTEATAKERTVAMRMALLVFTDFACWAPIIFFGTTAVFGKPLISVTNSKILIVFFYPLNSMANPFLYVISTRQYRRDLDYLTNRWHMWRRNLFKGNDSYYSNNAYIGLNQHPGALNVHLGAVAAMTGVADHLHHYQLTPKDDLDSEVNLMVGNVPDGIKYNNNKMHEHRVICSKGQKGSYIIRHQILTGNMRAPISSRKFNQQTTMMASPKKQEKANGKVEKVVEESDNIKPIGKSSPHYEDNKKKDLGLAPKDLKIESTSGDLTKSLIDDATHEQQVPTKCNKTMDCKRHITSRCCRCCPSHLCPTVRLPTASRRRSQITKTTDLPISDIVTDSRLKRSDLDMNSDTNFKNLCLLAAKESSEFKSIALVSPMIQSSNNEMSLLKDETGSTDQGSGLVDDIFRDSIDSISVLRESMELYRQDSLKAKKKPTIFSNGFQRKAIRTDDEKNPIDRHQKKLSKNALVNLASTSQESNSTSRGEASSQLDASNSSQMEYQQQLIKPSNNHHHHHHRRHHHRHHHLHHRHHKRSRENYLCEHHRQQISMKHKDLKDKQTSCCDERRIDTEEVPYGTDNIGSPRAGEDSGEESTHVAAAHLDEEKPTSGFVLRPILRDVRSDCNNSDSNVVYGTKSALPWKNIDELACGTESITSGEREYRSSIRSTPSGSRKKKKVMIVEHNSG